MFSSFLIGTISALSTAILAVLSAKNCCSGQNVSANLEHCRRRTLCRMPLCPMGSRHSGRTLLTKNQ